MYMFVYVCVYGRARARVCVCIRILISHSEIENASLYRKLMQDLLMLTCARLISVRRILNSTYIILLVNSLYFWK